MLYIVTEFAKNGEMFGELHSFLALVKPCLLMSACSLWGFSVLFFLAWSQVVAASASWGSNFVLLFLRLSDFQWAPE